MKFATPLILLAGCFDSFCFAMNVVYFPYRYCSAEIQERKFLIYYAN